MSPIEYPEKKREGRKKRRREEGGGTGIPEPTRRTGFVLFAHRRETQEYTIIKEKAGLKVWEPRELRT